MIRSSLLLAALLAAVVSSDEAGAQARLPVQPPIRQLTAPAHPSRDSQPALPREYRPPPGMCRVWLDGVPGSQQPAPTDCASAVRNRPNNGRVLFGDDYVDKKDRAKDKDNNKRPEGRAQAPTPNGRAMLVAFAPSARPHGPSAEESVDLMDARYESVPGIVAFAEQPPARVDSTRQPRRPATPPTHPLRDSTLSAHRRAVQDSVRAARRGDARDDRDDDDRDDRRDDRPSRDGQRGYGNNGNGYGSGYYPPYPPPARANGVCLDRDRDGWCDDASNGGSYCLDRDGDGRCDDYPGLASAPYSSSMPPMAAAVDVRNGRGSEIALRWLGTAEVIVRTSELRRTGTPYRVMWLDANTNRLLQVWTDRDGDGVADRVEIYRNGQVAKILGR